MEETLLECQSNSNYVRPDEVSPWLGWTSTNWDHGQLFKTYLPCRRKILLVRLPARALLAKKAILGEHFSIKTCDRRAHFQYELYTRKKAFFSFFLFSFFLIMMLGFDHFLYSFQTMRNWKTTMYAQVNWMSNPLIELELYYLIYKWFFLRYILTDTMYFPVSANAVQTRGQSKWEIPTTPKA